MERKPSRLRYSLARFLLLGVIVALLVSNVLTSSRLRLAELEIKTVRQNFGYINSVDDQKIYVTSVAKFQYARGTTLRIHFPSGRRYQLRISEVDSAWSHDDLQALNDADRIEDLQFFASENVLFSYDVVYDLRRQQPIIAIESMERQSTYLPSEWKEMSQTDPQATHLIGADDAPQMEFESDQPIALASFAAPRCSRVVVLWLDP